MLSTIFIKVVFIKWYFLKVDCSEYSKLFLRKVESELCKCFLNIFESIGRIEIGL